MVSRTERIHFSGRVQGVGFRWTTERLAGKLPLTGTVRNLPDGRVEVVVTGEPEMISRLVETLQDSFGEGISGVDRQIQEERQDFPGFTIRR